jgi:uncharacterized SAM-binding protein YcdF (DUF218 family)
LTPVCLKAAAPLFALLFVLCAPGFLFTENIPRKADAVILFVGPGNEARLGEAQQLIKEGYARYLLVPSSGELFQAAPAGALVRIAGNRERGSLLFRVRKAVDYKPYYENTHIEALEAKRMMDGLGLHSALMVSSAYHMRRIRMIAGRVFEPRSYSVSCNPARWQPPFSAADWLVREHRRVIVSEYLKIGWFLLYGVFGS